MSPSPCRALPQVLAGQLQPVLLSLLDEEQPPLRHQLHPQRPRHHRLWHRAVPGDAGRAPLLVSAARPTLPPNLGLSPQILPHLSVPSCPTLSDSQGLVLNPAPSQPKSGSGRSVGTQPLPPPQALSMLQTPSPILEPKFQLFNPKPQPLPSKIQSLIFRSQLLTPQNPIFVPQNPTLALQIPTSVPQTQFWPSTPNP